MTQNQTSEFWPAKAEAGHLSFGVEDPRATPSWCFFFFGGVGGGWLDPFLFFFSSFPWGWFGGWLDPFFWFFVVFSPGAGFFSPKSKHPSRGWFLGAKGTDPAWPKLPSRPRSTRPARARCRPARAPRSCLREFWWSCHLFFFPFFFFFCLK